MRRAAIIFAMLIAAVTWAALTTDEAALLDRALALYRDMHAGTYTVKVVSSSISNGRHVLKTEIRTASGLTFPGRLEFPVQAAIVERPGNALFLMGGTLWGVNYSRRIVGPFSLQCGAAWDGEPHLWGGIGWQWGK